MVQSSLNLAVVAVTDDVMPITEVLQVFPVAVWGDKWDCVSALGALPRLLLAEGSGLAFC